jgi:hypothetical protein
MGKIRKHTGKMYSIGFIELKKLLNEFFWMINNLTGGIS